MTSHLKAICATVLSSVPRRHRITPNFTVVTLDMADKSPKEIFQAVDRWKELLRIAALPR